MGKRLRELRMGTEVDCPSGHGRCVQRAGVEYAITQS